MANPLFLYYQESSSAPRYQEEASDALELSRLLQGHNNYWISPFLQKQEKKKKLVLADWSMPAWSEDKITQVQKKLSELLAEGFELYLWQDKKALLLDQKELSGLASKLTQVSKYICPSSSEEVQRVLGVSQEKLCILDDYWLSCVLRNEDPQSERTVSFYDYRHNPVVGHAWLLQATPCITAGLDDVFGSKKEDKDWDLFCSLFSQAPVEAPFRELTFINEQDTQRLNEEQFRVRVQGTVKFTIDMRVIGEHANILLAHMQNCDTLIGNVNCSQLLTLPKLKRIRLKNCENNAEVISLPPGTVIPQLEEINLSMSAISSASLEVLLKATPNLKKIALYGCKKIFDPISLSPNSLTQLEEVDFGESAITIASIEVLLKAAPNLKKYLGNNETIDGVTSLLQGDLNRLEEINLSRSAVSSISVETLLKKNPNLKKMDLRWCKNITDIISLPPDSLTQLEEINLYFSSISTPSLEALLKAAPNHKKIDLVGCRNIQKGRDIFFPLSSLSQLEEIAFSDDAISSSGIYSLLKNAPKLKKINSNNIIIDEISFPSGSLAHLEEVSLRSSELSSTSLEALLKAGPNLKKISLTGCKKILEPLYLSPDSLAQLEEIVLNSSALSGARVETLLKAAPNLKKISLSGCKNIVDDISMSPGSLSQLEEADFSYSAISKANVQAFQEAAPNLKILKLDDLPAELLEQLATKEGQKKFPAFPTGNSQKNWRGKPANPYKTNQNVDADTENKNARFKVDRIFYPIQGSNTPKPRMYRIDVFTELVLNPKPGAKTTAFQLGTTQDLALTARTVAQAMLPITKRDDRQFFQGFYETHLSMQWQPLPSLTPEDVLLSCSISPANTLFELAYSQKSNLYYVRQKAGRVPHQVTLEYTLAIRASKATVPVEIRALVHEFLNFSEGELRLSDAAYTGQDYAEAIYQQKKGACRHRAVAFKNQMQKKYPEFAVRIVTNECHAFVEVEIEGAWQVFDLGGYPSKLTIEDKCPPATETPVTELRQLADLNQDLPLSEELQRILASHLQTWVRKDAAASPLAYFQQCVSGEDGNNRLIELPSAETLTGLRYQIASYCQHIQRPVFYIHSPEVLVCASPSMVQGPEGFGVIKPGPSGPLHHFLTENTQGVLLVNYSNFTAEDLVRFNSLIDLERKADNTPVPQAMIVLGLIGKDAQNRPGSDFYSRFDVVEHCPLAAHDLTKELIALPRESADKSTHSIDLYHAPDWRTQLLGQWIPHQGHWHYKDGLLKQLLLKVQAQEPITLYNGLWDEAEFCHFWQTVQQTGIITTPIEKLAWDTSITLTRAEGYDWDQLKTSVKIVQECPSSYTVINPATFSTFFSCYELYGTQLEATPGFLELAATKKTKLLNLYVTHTLSEDMWAKLLSKKAEDLTIQIYCAPKVTLPEVLRDNSILSSLTPAQKLSESWPASAVIESDDVDVTVAHWLKLKPESLVIDVSELNATDLISRINGTLLTEAGSPLHLQFTQTQCALTVALGKEQPVVLKGRFSPALAGALAPLLLNNPNNLILVSEDISLFNYLPQRYTHPVSVEEKQALVKKAFPETHEELTAFVQKEGLVQVIARGQWLRLHGKGASDAAWEGIQRVTLQKRDPGVFNAIQWTPIAKAWSNARKQAVNQVLSTAPFVFLSGLSGVGKSTFVTQTLCGPNDLLYHGEEALLSWATESTEAKNKLLFIDEANLSPNQWSQFEGLFNNPPAILIQGVYHTLDAKRHKVIFAGNPLTYGDERQLAPFFARHGNAVLFEVLPSDVIYECILLPIFSGTALQAQAGQLSVPLLNVYRFLCLASQNDVLISPRELEMMALCTLSFCKKHPEADTLAVAQYMTYHLAKDLVPNTQQASFNNQFFPPQDCATTTKFTGNYLMTPSRQPINHWLDTFLIVREDRLTAKENVHRYGGLGGIILEGEPGIGKSELVTAALIAHDFHEVHNFKAPSLHQHSFYRLPVSMSLVEKEALLRQAFDKGMVVVVDEINSSPMMERLLNALLMGTTPEGIRPSQPGFMIIGTQNPASMAGRRSMSTAMQRRTMILQLPSYPQEEMCAILTTKGLEAQKAEALVTSYLQQRHYAHQHQLQPAPTFRDVLRVAKSLLKVSAIKKPDEEENPLVEVPPATTAVIKRNIQAILSGLSYQIQTIEKHRYKAAWQTATALLTELEQLKTVYYTALDAKNNDPKEVQQQFINGCVPAITKAKPILAKDLGWEEYLSTLLKDLSSADLTLGQRIIGGTVSFFTPVPTASTRPVADAEKANNGPHSSS